MNFVESIREKAKQAGKSIVLPEGNDPRTVQAAATIQSKGLANVIMLGDEKTINQHAEGLGVDISGLKIITPENDPNFDKFTDLYYQKRQAKGMTREKSREVMKNSLFFGTMMVHQGMVDGSVAGAVNTTGNVLKAALQIVGTAPGIKTVSSCLIIVLPQKIKDIDSQIFTFADCGVLPNPNAEQLANVAISTAKTHQALVGEDPIVAMLSFSTKGSAKHEDVDKVIEATRIAREIDPNLKIDGELQGDSALISSIGSRKAPGSQVAGKANVLVFPDLDSGNISYKLVQRLARADAFGPILQGLSKPCHDLSRGCNAEDIVMTAAIAAVQALG
ncbi:MAG: phosphate acetyltransferase [Candidatus Cloacimonetes bacterium 4572_55]|nr:MAG: phosphate acetyltransferase [Candidatus Cloacimonetes bacterium 4572_55]